CGPKIPAAALDASAPGMPRSMTTTRRPRWARRNDTAQPITPPPTTATSAAGALATRPLPVAAPVLARGTATAPAAPGTRATLGSLRGLAGALQPALERLRHPDLVFRVDDHRRA